MEIFRGQFVWRSLALALLFVACKTNSFRGDTPVGVSIPPLQSATFDQVQFDPRTVNLTQGLSGAPSAQNETVTGSGVLDLVVVIDNSGSMAEEQNNLAEKMSALMSAISNSDWQIAVTTTDPADNCVRSLIKKDSFLAETRFRNAINAGINGDGIERPFLKAVEALKSDCFWGPGHWVRPGSTVAVLIVTDEDNCHADPATGYQCNGLVDRESSYLVNYLSSIRKIGTEARVYGLLWHPSQPVSACPTAYKTAVKVSEAIQATGGTWGSICDTDFTPTLNRISSDVARILKKDFTLKNMPDAGTLRITVDGQPWTKFTQEGLVVHFTENPREGAAINVQYSSGAAGLVGNDFDLPDVPVDGSIQATVNGQSAGPLTWDQTRRKAVFQTKPADGSAIVITYNVAVPLKDTFQIAAGADSASVTVKVNGQVIARQSYTYDAATGSVKIAPPPPAGAKIEISWRGAARGKMQ